MATKLTNTGVEYPNGTTQTVANNNANCSNCSSYTSLTSRPTVPANCSNCSGDVTNGTGPTLYQCAQCPNCGDIQCGAYWKGTAYNSNNNIINGVEISGIEKTGTSLRNYVYKTYVRTNCNCNC